LDLTQIFFAIVILLAGAKLLGALFRKIKQPALGGEILAGIILGPTLFLICINFHPQTGNSLKF